VMRAIEALLPPHSAARGLSSRTLARLVYGAEIPTAAHVNSIDRAARRLIARGIAASAMANNGLKVYYRADAAPQPPAPPNDSNLDAIPIATQWE
jgi:hypothetical protein